MLEEQWEHLDNAVNEFYFNAIGKHYLELTRHIPRTALNSIFTTLLLNLGLSESDARNYLAMPRPSWPIVQSNTINFEQYVQNVLKGWQLEK